MVANCITLLLEARETMLIVTFGMALYSLKSSILVLMWFVVCAILWPFYILDTYFLPKSEKKPAKWVTCIDKSEDPNMIAFRNATS